MPDIRLVPVANPYIVTLDWLQTATGALDETAELATAVTVALCTDALADPSDVLPDPNSSDWRGWWGDTDAARVWGGWPIGSKLWLLKRAKILGAGSREGQTIARVQAYISACLQPFVSARIFSQFAISAQQTGVQRIDAAVTIYRGPKPSIALNFQAVWSELLAGK